MVDPDAHDADREAIERLHRRDVEASRRGDFRTLRSLMTDDAVSMPPGAPWVRGADAFDAAFEAMREQYAEIEVLEYDQEFEELVILGDHAFEYGTIRGAMRTADGEVERSTYKMLRVLQRQPDGEWKVHRTIWNADPSPTEESR